MGHKSIALFLKSSGIKDNGKHNNERVKFLCFKGEDRHFWEFNSRSMNGGFDRREFEKSLSDFFDFDFEGINFRYIASKEYEGKDYPASTAYVIEVNDKLFEKINTKLDETEEHKNYEWIVFENIKKVKNEWKKSQQYLIKSAIAGKALPTPPAFGNDFLTAIEHIQDAKEQGNLVIFVGAGISKNCGVPMWGELIEELRELVPVDEGETDYLVIPQLFYNEVGESQYHKTIQKILKHNRVKYDKKLYDSILALKPGHIVTTNYDDLIEQATAENTNSLNYSVIREDRDLPFAVSPNFLIKMHGDFEKKNIVLKEDDYLHYQNNFPLTENFIKGIFSSKLILFIGFSYSDANLKYIVERVRNVLQKNYQPAYLFDTNEVGKMSKHKVEYYKNRGIHILNYDAKIKTYLERRNLEETIDNNTQKDSSNRGQKVFNFLHFINHYNRNTERSKGLHIIDQMYNALRVYDELLGIPPKFLTKIEPFALGEKREEQAEYESLGFHFRTKNESIINLIKKTKIDGNEVVFENESTTSGVYNANKKVEYIFKKLTASGVTCIQRKDDGLSGNHYRITFKNSDSCNCPNCRLNRLEIHLLLQDLRVDKKHDIDCFECENSLNTAYVNFYVGNILECYRMLKNLCVESYREGKFITYFLAKYNIKQILWRVRGLSVNSEISVEEKKDVIKEIQRLNLPEIIEDLPVNRTIKSTLHYIAEENYLRDTTRKMQKDLTSIKNVHKIYENGGSRWAGRDGFNSMLYSFGAYYSFILVNFMLGRIYNNFKDLALMLWEGAVISYSTSDRYEYRLKEFDMYLFDVAIFNVSPYSLEKLFAHHKIYELPAKKESVEKLVDKGISLFSANHEVNNFFFNSVDTKSPFLIQKEKSVWFQQRVKEYSSNILLLLSKFRIGHLEKEKRDEFVLLTIQYLSVESRGFSMDEKFFVAFYECNLEYFDESLLTELIKVTVFDNINPGLFIKRICKEISKSHPEFEITDHSLYRKIIKRTSKRDRLKIYTSDIVPFYALFSVENKLRFEEYIKDILYDENVKLEEEEEFDRDLYFECLYNYVFPFKNNKFFDYFFKDRILKFNPIFDGEDTDASYYYSWNRIGRFFKMYFEGVIKLNKKQLESVIKKDTPLFYQWVFAPKDFDYDKFDPKWLTLLTFSKGIDKISKMKIPQLRKAIVEYLKENNKDEVSDIYWKYYA